MEEFLKRYTTVGDLAESSSEHASIQDNLDSEPLNSWCDFASVGEVFSGNLDYSSSNDNYTLYSFSNDNYDQYNLGTDSHAHYSSSNDNYGQYSSGNDNYVQYISSHDNHTHYSYSNDSYGNDSYSNDSNSNDGYLNGNDTQYLDFDMDTPRSTDINSIVSKHFSQIDSSKSVKDESNSPSKIPDVNTAIRSISPRNTATVVDCHALVLRQPPCTLSDTLREDSPGMLNVHSLPVTNTPLQSAKPPPKVIAQTQKRTRPLTSLAPKPDISPGTIPENCTEITKAPVKSTKKRRLDGIPGLLCFPIQTPSKSEMSMQSPELPPKKKNRNPNPCMRCRTQNLPCDGDVQYPCSLCQQLFAGTKSKMSSWTECIETNLADLNIFSPDINAGKRKSILKSIIAEDAIGRCKKLMHYCFAVVDGVLNIAGNEERQLEYAKAITNDNNCVESGVTELKLSMNGKKAIFIENRFFRLLHAEYGEALLIAWLAALSRNGSVVFPQLNLSEQQWFVFLDSMISDLLSSLTKRLRSIRKLVSKSQAECLFAITSMLWQAVDVIEQDNPNLSHQQHKKLKHLERLIQYYEDLAIATLNLRDEHDSISTKLYTTSQDFEGNESLSDIFHIYLEKLAEFSTKAGSYVRGCVLVKTTTTAILKNDPIALLQLNYC